MKVSNNLDMALVEMDSLLFVTVVKEYTTPENGEFMMDKEGYVVTPTGMRLQGYQSINNVIQPNLGDIRVPLGDISALNTTEVTMTANLDADADDSTTPLGDINSNSYDPNELVLLMDLKLHC